MAYPQVIPHSDAAGVIDAVGQGVDASHVGRRVRVYGAQSYRAFGTAGELTVVPDALAVDLPDNVSDELGASPHDARTRAPLAAPSPTARGGD